MFHWRLSLLLGLSIALDQSSKWWAYSTLEFYHSIPIIPKVFELHLLVNRGAAYGLFDGYRLSLLLLTLFVILFSFLFQSYFASSKLLRFGLVFLTAGAIGNFIDRLILGGVIDFLHLTPFPVFNVADLLINAGLVCFFLDMFRKNA